MTKPEERKNARCELRHLGRPIAENVATNGYEYRRTRQRIRSLVALGQAFVTHPDMRWVRALVGSLAY
jgi:hypothetical protein